MDTYNDKFFNISPQEHGKNLELIFSKLSEFCENVVFSSSIKRLKSEANEMNNPYRYELRGEAEYFTSGEWIDRIKQIPENEGESCKGAILVKVENKKFSLNPTRSCPFSLSLSLNFGRRPQPWEKQKFHLQPFFTINMKEKILFERNEVCKTRLVVPFKSPSKGEGFSWKVGRRHSARDEGFSGVGHDHGFDFLITDKNGNSFAGDQKSLESYYAYGEEVKSPGTGRIIHSHENDDDSPVFIGEDDDFIKKQNHRSPSGNFIIIDHGNGEFSHISHLMKESVGVRIGEMIESGEGIGRVGNTGNSTEPHIHYHVFRLRPGYDITQVIDALSRPYPHFNLRDGERNENGFNKILSEIGEMARKYKINKLTPLENWPEEMLEKISPALKGVVGINPSFNNIQNRNLKEGEKIEVSI